MHHILKIKEAYYDAKLEGSKMFEIRHNDRGFQKGDTVSYKVEWSPGQWTDPQGLYEITYVCLLYTSPSPRDGLLSRMPSSA